MATVGLNTRRLRERARAGQLLEFLLVLILLVALVWLVTYVMSAPVLNGVHTAEGVTGKDVLGYRSGILTGLLGAFGAWIGAGAAYFFGSKNLQQATEAMEKAQGTGLARLERVSIRDLKPQRINWSLSYTDKVEDARTWLDDDAERWWFPVVDEQGRFDTVLHEECVFRFVEDAYKSSQSTHSDVLKKTGKDFAQWVKDNLKDKKGTLWAICVPVTMDMSARAADEAMMAKGVHVGIITDDSRKPIYSITEGDIKKALE